MDGSRYCSKNQATCYVMRNRCSSHNTKSYKKTFANKEVTERFHSLLCTGRKASWFFSITTGKSDFVKALANGFNICFNILSILLNGNVESVCHPLSTLLKRVEKMLIDVERV